jgi:hypothetical protein
VSTLPVCSPPTTAAPTSVKGHHRLSLLIRAGEDANGCGCGPDVDGGLKTSFLVVISSLWFNAHS